MGQVETEAQSNNFSGNFAMSADMSAVAQLPYGSTLSVVNTLQELHSLKQAWHQLESKSRQSPSVFQSFDWISSWSDIYAGKNADAELLIITGYTDGELVFAWPLMKERKWGISVLSWLTEPSGQYGDILLDANHSASVWMKASVQLLERLKGLDVLRLRHIRSDADSYQFASESLLCGKQFDDAPFLDLANMPTDKEYDARYSSAQRKRRKKIRQSLESLGALAFTSIVPGVTADIAMSNAIEQKNLWLKQRGRRNLILRCPRHLEFLKTLARNRNERVEVITTELSVGKKPVSWEIGFRYRGTHFAYITSHMTEMTDLSPGRLHMDLSQRKAIADKQLRFDLMVPNDPHKESWSSGKVQARDFYRPLSWRGRVYGFLYLKTLRPVVRRIYYRLPRNVLVALQAVSGH